MGTRIEVVDLCCDHCDSKCVSCDHCYSNWVCCDHCDSKWACCDFVRPTYLRGFMRPKKGMLRPLRLNVDRLRLCATKLFARLWGTQNRYLKTLWDSKKGMLRTLRLKMGMLRLCAGETFAAKTDMLRLPWSRFAIYVSTDTTQAVYVSTTLEKMLR